MAQILKDGIDPGVVAAADEKVRDIVEATLADIAKRGDAAVRELSIKFDKWDRDDYRLSADEIDVCLADMSAQDEFAQERVRNFAQIQRDSMGDVRDDARRHSGPQEYPRPEYGLLRAGGQTPHAGLGPYVGTDRIGRRRIVTCAPPYQGKPASAPALLFLM